jgi:transcriptional regulator with XRE-family HTH domain
MKPALLKEIRERLGLTVSEFAHILGVMPRTYYRYESAKTRAPLTVERLIVTLLKCPNVLNESIAAARQDPKQ